MTPFSRIVPFSCFVLVSLLLFLFCERSSATRCSSSVQCADNQVCFSGRCQCEMGYFGLPNGFGVDCNRHDCGEESDHNQQCSAAFGQHSTCGFVEGQPRCVCTEGSVWNPRTERCQIIPHRPRCENVHHHCSSPVGSICGTDHHCHCRPGYEPRVLPTFKDSLFKVICALKRCSSDWQCGHYGGRCSPAGICERE